MSSIVHMYRQRCKEMDSLLEKLKNWNFEYPNNRTMKGKEKKTEKTKQKKEGGGKKNRGPRGCPPLRCRHKLSKRKKKIIKEKTGVQGVLLTQIQTCQKKATRTCNYTKKKRKQRRTQNGGAREWPPQRFRHKLAKKTYFRSQIVHPWWPGSSETSIWNNPAVTMRLFTLIGVIIWNSQCTQTAKSCSRTNTLVQVWIEHTFTFCMTSTGMNRSNWNLDLKSFSYFSHYVSHSLKWSFGKLSACKLPKLALLYFSHYVSHSNFDFK